MNWTKMEEIPYQPPRPTPAIYIFKSQNIFEVIAKKDIKLFYLFIF